jgi:hypothetical protein
VVFIPKYRRKSCMENCDGIGWVYGSPNRSRLFKGGGAMQILLLCRQKRTGQSGTVRQPLKFMWAATGFSFDSDQIEENTLTRRHASLTTRGIYVMYMPHKRQR